MYTGMPPVSPAQDDHEVRACEALSRELGARQQHCSAMPPSRYHRWGVLLKTTISQNTLKTGILQAPTAFVYILIGVSVLWS